MKIVLLNKSDSTGGAAVVSRRLLEALRSEGVEAFLLVCEKLSDSPYVIKAAPEPKIKLRFFAERLKIFLANGFNRKTLFQIDTGDFGLPLWNHPLVKSADAIIINWVNQGMLSLKGYNNLLKLGIPVIWTMHDMWNMTGICHHAHECRHFIHECGSCPLLHSHSPHDLSFKILNKKLKIYSDKTLNEKAAFVAVSTWLKSRADISTALMGKKVFSIPNAFRPVKFHRIPREDGKVRILFGAARLDDPIKGLDTLIETARILKFEYPDIARHIEFTLFGNIKNENVLENFPLPLSRPGVIQGENNLAQLYADSDILVSASSYETLPGTLVEAQAYGSIPVSFKRGGQADIITHLATGFLAEYDQDILSRARNLAHGIVWACGILNNPREADKIIQDMKRSVSEKFSYQAVANAYLKLIRDLS